MLQDWNFTTTPVEGLNNRVLEYPRGFVLGGSTSISERHAHLSVHKGYPNTYLDFMAYSRGTRDDYDRWANITEDDGWSWDNLYPYMIKVRTFDISVHTALIYSCIHPRWRI